MSNAWRGTLMRQGLLLADNEKKDDAVPVHRRGVKLEWLEAFIKACPTDATQWTCLEVVSKLLGGSKNRLWDSIPAQYKAQPTCFVIAAWCTTIAATVDALRYALHPPPAPGQAVQAHHLSSGHEAVLWIDWVAVGGSQLAAAGVAAGRDAPEKLGDAWAEAAPTYMRDLAAGCENGAVLVIDPSATALQSARCLYSSWAAMAYAGNDPLRLSVALPKDPPPSLIARLLGTGSSTAAGGLVVDIARVAAAGCVGAKLMADVKRVAGAQRASSQLSAAVARGTRLALRAAVAHSLHAAALRVGVLLGEGSLRLALGAAQEAVAAHDVGAELEELRALFKMYDEDGSGALDEEELAEVMEAGGWGRQEGARVFAAMTAGRRAQSIGDKSGEEEDGGVTLEEFEAWWLSSAAARDAERCQGWGPPRIRGKATVSALAAAVRALVALLESRHAVELAHHVHGCLAAHCPAAAALLDTPAADPKSGSTPETTLVSRPKLAASTSTVGTTSARGKAAASATAAATAVAAADGDSELPPIRIAGSWQEAGDAALWATRGGLDAMSAAARGLHDVVLSNLELLPCPPSTLPCLPPPPSSMQAAAAPSSSNSTQSSGHRSASLGCAPSRQGARPEVQIPDVLGRLMVAYADGVVTVATGRTSGDVAVFRAAADELRAVAAAGHPPGRPRKTEDPPMGGALSSAEGQALVRNLISLKYGSRAASRTMRTEAGVALSQITAGARTGAGRSGEGRVNMSSIDSYLSSTSNAISSVPSASFGTAALLRGNADSSAAGAGGAAAVFAAMGGTGKARRLSQVIGMARTLSSTDDASGGGVSGDDEGEGESRHSPAPPPGRRDLGRFASMGAARGAVAGESSLAAGLDRVRRLQRELSQRSLGGRSSSLGVATVGEEGEEEEGEDMECGRDEVPALRTCGVADLSAACGGASEMVRRAHKVPGRSVTLGSAIEFAARATGGLGSGGGMGLSQHGRAAGLAPYPSAPSLSSDGPPSPAYPQPRPPNSPCNRQAGMVGLTLPPLANPTSCTDASTAPLSPTHTLRSTSQLSTRSSQLGSSCSQTAPLSPTLLGLTPSPPNSLATISPVYASRLRRGSLPVDYGKSLAAMLAAGSCDLSHDCDAVGHEPTRCHPSVGRAMSMRNIAEGHQGGGSSDESDVDAPDWGASLQRSKSFVLAGGPAGGGDSGSSHMHAAYGMPGEDGEKRVVGRTRRSSINFGGVVGPQLSEGSGANRSSSVACMAPGGAGSAVEQLRARRKSHGNLIMAACRDGAGLGGGTFLPALGGPAGGTGRTRRASVVLPVSAESMLLGS